METIVSRDIGNGNRIAVENWISDLDDPGRVRCALVLNKYVEGSLVFQARGKVRTPREVGELYEEINSEEDFMRKAVGMNEQEVRAYMGERK